MSTIVELLDEAQRRFSNNTALVTKRGFRTERWTYRHLSLMSKRISVFLQQRGIKKCDRIVLWAHNSPEWVAAYFGCLRAGAILVPLDVRSSSDFVLKVMERTQPALAFVSTETTQTVQCLRVPALRLEDVERFLETVQLPHGEIAVSPDDIAEVVFTSGTTGDPKGVVLTHRNIVANVRAATQLVPSKPSYRVLSLLPLSHMLEQTVGLLAPLAGGASIHYPQSRQSTVIFRAFKEYRITTVVLVPQALHLFMNAIEARVREKGKEKLWSLLHKVAPRLPMLLRRRLFAQVHKQLGGNL